MDPVRTETTTPRDRMKIRTGLEAAGMTDVGCQRDNNEDHFAYWEPQSDAQFKEKGRLAVVADGMGGYEGGQEASHIAVDAVLDVYRSKSDPSPQALLLDAVKVAHGWSQPRCQRVQVVLARVAASKLTVHRFRTEAGLGVCVALADTGRDDLFEFGPWAVADDGPRSE